MFFEASHEFKIKQNEKKLRELRLRVETLNLEIDEFLTALDVTPEQIRAYVDNPANFDAQTWDRLQEERQKLDAKLAAELESIDNPARARQAYQSLNIAPHWIFVR